MKVLDSLDLKGLIKMCWPGCITKLFINELFVLRVKNVNIYTNLALLFYIYPVYIPIVL